MFMSPTLLHVVKIKYSKKMEQKHTEERNEPNKSNIVPCATQSTDCSAECDRRSEFHAQSTDCSAERDRRSEITIAMVGNVDSSKCLGVNTPILMHNFSRCMVQDIKEGDRVLGDDYRPRTVVSTTCGKGPMYRVEMKCGGEYVVNRYHVLSLYRMNVEKITELESSQCYECAWWEGTSVMHKHFCWEGSGKEDAKQKATEYLKHVVPKLPLYEPPFTKVDIEIEDYLSLDDKSRENLWGYKIKGRPFIPYPLKISSLPENDYYGFMLEVPSDPLEWGGSCPPSQRFLLGDFTVTHNSTTTGVLTDVLGRLDDGNGLARGRILHHPHEKESGRTSSIGHAYIKEDDRIINFIDLAGHEKYLKTTIKGVTQYYPDYALLCVEKNLTHMTREHLKLILTMKIPFMFLVTKIDIVPPDTLKENIRKLKRYVKQAKKVVFEIKKKEDIETVVTMDENIVPLLQISNVTGENIDLLKHFVRRIRKREHKYLKGFVVDSVYVVKGYGTIVSGVTGIDIRKGDDLFIGPMINKDFAKTRVRSIHNDYREFVDVLPAGTRGCLWIKWEVSNRKMIRSGMVLAPQPLNVVKRFKANVVIFHHHTTIKQGYEAYANIGAIKEPIRFANISGGTLRSGDKTEVDLEFIKHYNYIESGSQFFFREGSTRGIGKVLSVYDDEQYEEQYEEQSDVQSK